MFSSTLMLKRIWSTLTTWQVSIPMKIKMVHSANVLMRKMYCFNIYILPNKICTFCKRPFDDTVFSSLQSTVHTHTHTHSKRCFKCGTIVISTSKREELARASHLGLGSSSLPYGGERLFVLESPLYWWIFDHEQCGLHSKAPLINLSLGIWNKFPHKHCFSFTRRFT